MIKFPITYVYNLLPAIKHIRIAYDSLEKSDSLDGKLGSNDKELAEGLSKLGSSHRKFMRQIFVATRIEAPKYWWKEFDTYKIGVTQNSSSTMHTITKRHLTKDDFSYKHGMDNSDVKILEVLNSFIDSYNKSDEEYEKKYYKQKIIEKLPDNYIYKRFVTLNYEVLTRIVKQRNNHELEEWHEFIDWIRDLPESDLIFKGAK
ncbi:MAG: hypothetical protein ACOCRO_03875 [Halanaerobiales bacterium]